MAFTKEEIRECTMIALDQPPWWPEIIDNTNRLMIFSNEQTISKNSDIFLNNSNYENNPSEK